MYKKLLSLLLIMALCLCVTACDDTTRKQSAKSIARTTVFFTTSTSATGQTCVAVGLYVDGRLVGIMESETAIQTVLEALQTEATASFADGTDLAVSFVQDVKTKEGQCAAADVMDAAEMTERLTTESVVDVTYEVQTGDTFTGIAAKHNLTEEELKNLNPAVDSTTLEVGQELTVQRTQRLLQTQVTVATYEEGVVIPYKTKTVYRDDKESDWSQVTIEGKDGVKNVTTHVTYVDGVETDRVEDEEIIKEAVTKVVERGSKGTATTDTWVWPVPICHRVYLGYSSSHLAIDISSGPEPVLGKPAVAANGGTVIEASTGWNDGYGYTVKIQHDNGLITVYAHLQSVSVEVGQRVAAGQEIGKVGNTGLSNGPHLHFEVIKNGVRVNPLNYVKP